MNAVVNLLSNGTHVSKLRENGYGDADFNVVKERLHYYPASDNYEGRQFGKNVFYREDNGDYLGQHGIKYQEVTHKAMIDSARSILERSNLDLEGVTENIQVGSSGAMCFVRHEVPNCKITTPDGDSGCLTLLHINSYNSKWPLCATVGLNQNACTNSQVFTNGAATIYKNRHTMNLDLYGIARLINKVIVTLDEENDKWHSWYRTPCNDRDALQKFLMISKSSEASKAIEDSKHSVLTLSTLMNVVSLRENSSIEYLWNRWRNHYAKNLGKNYWSLYNTLTDWSTKFSPQPRRNSTVDIPMVRHKNETKVRDVLDSFPLAA